MPANHPHKKGAFACADESDTMVDKNTRQSKIISGATGDEFALVLGHRLVCFIFNPLDLTSILHRSHHSSKINHRPGIKIDRKLRRCRFFQALLG
jgi:hypothetical protein